MLYRTWYLGKKGSSQHELKAIDCLPPRMGLTELRWSWEEVCSQGMGQ